MSSFRDTFTKDEKKDNLLDYDDSAFLYFGGTVLLSVLIPWSYRFLSNLLAPDVKSILATKSPAGSTYRYCKCDACVERVQKSKQEQLRWSRRFSWYFFVQLLGLVALWSTFGLVAMKCTGTRQIQSFDPFEILDISLGATEKEVKKAYRIMSLKFHPDKNPNDPTAGAKFVMIAKAYQSLTDEVSKRNFEKYGNPDGPGVMKVGIGLPRILVEEEYQLFFLLLFFTLLLVVLPLIFICYYQRQKRYAQNGVQTETLHFLSYYLSEGTRMKNGPEFLAASGESRELSIRASDNADMKPLINEVIEPRKRQFNLPIIVRNYFLICGHMQRLHHLMSGDLKSDLDKILSKALLIVQTMIELALVSNWFLTAQAMIEFHRSLVQCLGTRNVPLMQLPHFDDDMVKQVAKLKNAARDLKILIRQPSDDRKILSKLTVSQIANVNAVCQHVSDMDVEAKLCVDDEKEMVIGDVATCRVKMTRRNLAEGEAVGPVHAPLFPELKFENWWIFLINKGTGGLLGFAKTKSPERVIEEKIQFPLRKAGRHEFEVVCLCDSYSGMDATIEITCRVFTEKEIKREVYIHPDDEALDNEPTLFQQMLGQLEGGEDSSDEEDGKGDEKQTAASVGDETEPEADQKAATEEDASSSSSEEEEE